MVTRPLALVSVLLSGFAAPPALSALTWIVPGVANVSGANGTSYLSDLAIANGGAEDRIVTLVLITPADAASPPPAQYTIGAGETRRLDNVLDAAWQTTGVGAVGIAADGPVTIFARTYNVGAPPVLPDVPVPEIGSALPVIAENRLLAPTEEGHSGWLTQSSDPAGARTNVAVVFPDETGGAATATIFDVNGKILGGLFFNASRPVFDQRSVASLGLGDIPVGRVLVRVTRGRAAACTLTANNATGDLTIFPTERRVQLPTGVPFTAVSSGVAQIGGREGAFWHTEARLSNPSAQFVTVTAYLLGGSGSFPRQDFQIAAGATVAIPNLLTSLFNISGPAAGAVLWKSSAPLWIATSTTSSIALSFKKGTAGAANAAVPFSSFLYPADGPADLADARGGNVAWTNLMVAAGPAGATCAFEARRSDGRFLGSARVTLPPLGWGEFTTAALFGSVALPERIRLQVTLDSGSAGVQAFVVDSLTDDGVLYEAVPRNPAAPPPSPPLAPGIWGAADGSEGMKVDAEKIVVERFCRKGTFSQPVRLDSLGRFAVVGDYDVRLGPPVDFTAIFSGVTDGQTATVAISRLEGALAIDLTQTYILGMSYSVPPGPCPIEY